MQLVDQADTLVFDETPLNYLSHRPTTPLLRAEIFICSRDFEIYGNFYFVLVQSVRIYAVTLVVRHISRPALAG
jgi:hypothetical protein